MTIYDAKDIKACGVVPLPVRYFLILIKLYIKQFVKALIARFKTSQKAKKSRQGWIRYLMQVSLYKSLFQQFFVLFDPALIDFPSSDEVPPQFQHLNPLAKCDDFLVFINSTKFHTTYYILYIYYYM